MSYHSKRSLLIFFHRYSESYFARHGGKTGKGSGNIIAVFNHNFIGGAQGGDGKSHGNSVVAA